MRILIVLPLLLSLAACRITDSASDDPASDMWAAYDAYKQYVSRLTNFHLQWGVIADSSYLTNGSKVNPTDSIDLLPPDIAPPANAHIRWRYLSDPEFQELDPDHRSKVPLHDGILIQIEGSDMPEKGTTLVQHLAQSALAPPTITPLDRLLEYWTDSISVTSPRPGALIHYTLDGTYPTTSSPVYTGRIALDHPTWIRAMAEVPGVATSLSAQSLLLPAGGWNPGIAYDTLRDPRDGQSYPTVRLGDRTWMAKNLNWSAPGPMVRDLTVGGRYTLSQVHATGDSSLCPEGWHVSTQADWDSLVAWGIRQPGVYVNNVGSALRTSHPPDFGPQPSRIAGESSNLVDLWGFRAITTEFWTSSRGPNSPSTLRETLLGGAVLSSEVPDSSANWLRLSAGGGVPYTEHLAAVRCVHD